jgi:hypothetical protein
MPVCLCACVPACLPVCLFICLSAGVPDSVVCNKPISQSNYLPVNLPACLNICLPLFTFSVMKQFHLTLLCLYTISYFWHFIHSNLTLFPSPKATSILKNKLFSLLMSYIFNILFLLLVLRQFVNSTLCHLAISPTCSMMWQRQGKMLINLSCLYFTNVCNKLERILMFAGKARAYPSDAPLRCCYLG